MRGKAKKDVYSTPVCYTVALSEEHNTPTTPQQHMKANIRDLYDIYGMPIHAICLELGISREEVLDALKED